MERQIKQLKEALDRAKAVVIGAGSGLSTSAGFTYAGERFRTFFSDFEKKYGFHDMYTGGFYPFGSLEEHWAYWSRFIWLNRYTKAPKPVYEQLKDLIKDKNCFVLTTNVDHCFQKAGFDKDRLFYTQGDYGLWQCVRPCHKKTYDNREIVRKMVLSQGFEIDGADRLFLPEGTIPKMTIPSDLVPHCPKCGSPMTMNLRSDDTFVEDQGWKQASKRYEKFLGENIDDDLLFLELGVGMNTPGIIKYPFWQMTYRNPKTTYACVNYGEAYAPKEIAERSICIDGDIGEIIKILSE